MRYWLKLIVVDDSVYCAFCVGGFRCVFCFRSCRYTQALRYLTIPNDQDTVVIAKSPGGEQALDPPQPSPRHNTTNKGAMEGVLAAIESLGEGRKFKYQQIADKYSVNRSALSRRHRGV
jgi:hypothetical protein